MSKVCVFFGTGYEEIEALTVVDLLRRENIETSMVSVNGELEVTGSHGITVKMDQLISDVNFEETEMIVLPGGTAGAQRLEACPELMEQVDTFIASGKAVSAICAAPSILGHRGHLEGKSAISYPSFENHLKGANVVKEPVVQDGNIITGRGMGCSIDFALKIVEYFTNKEESRKLADKIVYKKKEGE